MDLKSFENDHFCQKININLNKIVWIFLKIFWRIFQEYLPKFNDKNNHKVGKCGSSYPICTHDGSSSFVGAIRICWSTCFYFWTWTLHYDLGSTHYRDILLFKGFESCVLCMSKATLWDRKCCSLMMSITRPFEIPSATISSLNILEDKGSQKKMSNG